MIERKEGSSTPLALLDLDDTLYQGLVMADLFEDQIARQLLLPTKAAESLRQEIHMYQNGKRGKASNVTALNAWWSAACVGLPQTVLFNHACSFIKDHTDKFFSYTKPIFNHLNTKGYETWIITGEPQFVAQAVADELGATGFCATTWNIDQRGRVTGKIRYPLTSKRKGQHAAAFFNPSFRYDRETSIAFVDSSNDIGLVKAVPFIIVCGKGSPDLIDYLANSGKNYRIAEPQTVLIDVKELIG